MFVVGWGRVGEKDKQGAHHLILRRAQRAELMVRSVRDQGMGDRWGMGSLRGKE